MPTGTHTYHWSPDVFVPFIFGGNPTKRTIIQFIQGLTSFNQSKNPGYKRVEFAAIRIC